MNAASRQQREPRSELIREVRDNLRDGASHLARVALDSLASYASVAPGAERPEVQRELLSFADELARVRPSMTAIHNLVKRWRETVQGFDGDADALRVHAREQAQAVRNWADAATDATVRAALNLIGDDRRVMTHSISSTVTRVFMRLQRPRAIVTESRPGLEGWNLAATLARRGIDVTYITDAQAGLFVREADMVVVGADSILADGALVNKAGTCLIALAAREAGVPFYVCGESFKCTSLLAAEAVLEEKTDSELGPPPVPGVHAHNIYFDITPPDLITDWISNEPLAGRFAAG